MVFTCCILIVEVIDSYVSLWNQLQREYIQRPSVIKKIILKSQVEEGEAHTHMTVVS
jgi:hypothetical protein